MLAAAFLAALVSLLPAVALAAPGRPTLEAPPGIEAVVSAAGYTPTPQLSESFRAGMVLVPNDRGGFDEVVSRCVEAEPRVSAVAASQVAAALSGGVSARLGVGSAAAAAGVEKRLTFIDPEQRTIPLAELVPTEACRAGVARAAQLSDLRGALLVHDVLFAIIESSTCTRADARGGLVALGAAEASAWSECVQQSAAQVALGYKAVPLEKVLQVHTLVKAPPAAARSGGPSAAPGCPWSAVSSVAAVGRQVSVNGAVHEVGGDLGRLRFADTLRACGLTESAVAFDAWRRRRAQLGWSWGVPVYGWVFLGGTNRRERSARQDFEAAMMGQR